MNALSTQVILIIVSSLAMGAALLKTGGADYLANAFVSITFGAPAPAVMMGLMLMMAILTNVVSNNAAAVIGTPIAIGIAQRLPVWCQSEFRNPDGLPDQYIDYERRRL
jgi:di/tricarboxylate transporter